MSSCRRTDQGKKKSLLKGAVLIICLLQVEKKKNKSNNGIKSLTVEVSMVSLHRCITSEQKGWFCAIISCMDAISAFKRIRQPTNKCSQC